MNANVIQNTPFGFIFELLNECCHFSLEPYKIFINKTLYSEANKNVVSIYGLRPDTDYNVRLEGCRFGSLSFDVHTEKVSYLINVKDYNAITDRDTDNTGAINAAIYSAPTGAVVYFPKGCYMVSHIFLKNGVDIYLEKGAVIYQSINRKSLAVTKGLQRNYNHSSFTVNASSEGHPLDCYGSLIYGKAVKDVRVYGEGILDGNGDISGFWEKPNEKDVAFRPKNIFLTECSRISISGITSRNSASWNTHPFYCDNLDFYSVRFESEITSPDADGLNPESSRFINIVGCEFHIGHDCIAIKSGKQYMARHNPKPSTNITIRNCYMGGGRGGVVIGEDTSSGVRSVSVEKCYFKRTDRGLRIKTRRGRGASSVVSGVTLSNVIMDGVRHCITVNMFYPCDPDGKSDYVKNKNTTIADSETPTVKNIRIENIICKDITGSAAFVYGLPERKVENIYIQSSRFSFADNRIDECPEMMDDFHVIPKLGVFVENAENVRIENNDFQGVYTNSISGGDLVG